MAEDLATFFTPGTNTRFLTRLAAPLIGNVGEEAAKQWGFSNDTASKLKMGLMFLTTLASDVNGRQFANQNFQRVVQNAPRNVNLPADNWLYHWNDLKSF